MLHGVMARFARMRSGHSGHQLKHKLQCFLELALGFAFLDE
ncbi:hypothetical protein GAGA_2979 [Paraglaciecola agarilytica NO2]|uniref:Transposase n=1 Tax=Paraglaciecola agarilytica NO2 TaxID=1125747 RepID=A0ABQ0I901_9ALTE|nr:hypothetical protein GAGA_2979 [Paraglaciecola agarilytica NO2]